MAKCVFKAKIVKECICMILDISAMKNEFGYKIDELNTIKDKIYLRASCMRSK